MRAGVGWRPLRLLMSLLTWVLRAAFTSRRSLVLQACHRIVAEYGLYPGNFAQCGTTDATGNAILQSIASVYGKLLHDGSKNPSPRRWKRGAGATAHTMSPFRTCELMTRNAGVVASTG